MMENGDLKKKKMKKEMVRDWSILLGLVVVAIVLLMAFPNKKTNVMDISLNYLIELMWVLPAVMVIIGLFSVFVPNDMVAKYLGKSSGVKGILLSIGIGMLPTGPLYVAFPMAAAMLKKGARISNIIVFLSAWACLKLPQEMVELQFLGFQFMALRLILTIFFVILMGITIEKIMKWHEGKKESMSGA